jgi:uncharacterized protein (TIGR03437 family)
VALRLNYADPVSYAASATVDDGDGWLTVTPTLGQISADAPVELRVAVAPGRLAPGMHTGSVHVSVGNELRTVRVSFAIGPEAAAAAAADSKATVVARVAGGCTPTHTAFAQTVLASNFSAVAGAPVALGASVIDNCGAVLTGASVEARFSNGDASVSFEPNGIQGEYTAVWQPGVADSQTIITIEASSPGLAPARLELTGAVLANPDPAPRLSPGGILNNLSGELGGALAPGTATQMFGENLAPYISRAAEAPLPMKALGIEVMIGESKGDMDAPLYYLSPSQLTVQMPTELTAAGTYSAVVAVRDGFTLPELIDVVPFRAAAATSGGALLAFHADGAPVGGAPTTSVFGSVGVSLAPGAARPARPGEEVSIFLVGMGSTTPAVASGKASPRVPLATVAQLATVQVDGAPAVVTFQGLTPGQVGLYQMNFRVPDSARPGDLEVKIWQSDVAAQSGTLAVERP